MKKIKNLKELKINDYVRFVRASKHTDFSFVETWFKVTELSNKIRIYGYEFFDFGGKEFKKLFRGHKGRAREYFINFIHGTIYKLTEKEFFDKCGNYIIFEGLKNEKDK